MTPHAQLIRDSLDAHERILAARWGHARATVRRLADIANNQTQHRDPLHALKAEAERLAEQIRLLDSGRAAVAAVLDLLQKQTAADIFARGSICPACGCPLTDADQPLCADCRDQPALRPDPEPAALPVDRFRLERETHALRQKEKPRIHSFDNDTGSDGAPADQP